MGQDVASGWVEDEEEENGLSDWSQKREHEAKLAPWAVW